MLLKAIMDMMMTLHAAEDAIIKFNNPVYAGITPAVQRPTIQAAFKITS
jgi:hypothetical protein